MMARTPFNMISARAAGFASEFKKLDRSIEQFDASSYVLPKTDSELLVKQPWSQRPFDSSKELTMPIYEFVSGRFAN